jgi:DNA topoisomerase-1
MTDNTLVIVESPGKIKKIQHILGDEYTVMASVGHIIELDPHSMSINFEDNFKPIYITIKDKQDVIRKLKKAYKNANDILLATDEDREGEMIAWSLAKELHIKSPKRIAFNSITKKELLDAIKKPGKINNNLVEAQNFRRLLDRIIGYKIGPILGNYLNSKPLPAGRVLSVVVKLIIEKENEITHFFENDAQSYFKTSAEFIDKDKHIFKANHNTSGMKIN